MIANGKVEFSDLSPLLHHHVFFFGETDRSICGWNIRDTLVECEEFCFYSLIFRFEGLDFFFYGFRFFEKSWIWFPIPLLRGARRAGWLFHACREFISPCTQSIELLLKFYSFDIETDHFFEVDSLHHFIMESFSDEIRIGAQYSNIDHEWELRL